MGSFFRERFLPELFHTIIAAQFSAVGGALVYTAVVVLADVFQPDFRIVEVFSAFSLFVSIFVVAMVLVNTVALVVAFPLRLMVRKRLSIMATMLLSALCAGVLYAAPYGLSFLESVLSATGEVDRAGNSGMDWFIGCASLFGLGVLFGGCYGLAIGWLERWMTAKRDDPAGLNS